MCGLEKNPYAYTYNAQKFKKKYSLPRIIWVQKDWTLNQIHKEVFMCIRWLFSEWADLKDPDSGREDKNMLKRSLPEFPYKPADWPKDKAVTKADWDALSGEE